MFRGFKGDTGRLCGDFSVNTTARWFEKTQHQEIVVRNFSRRDAKAQRWLNHWLCAFAWGFFPDFLNMRFLTKARLVAFIDECHFVCWFEMNLTQSHEGARTQRAFANDSLRPRVLAALRRFLCCGWSATFKHWHVQNHGQIQDWKTLAYSSQPKTVS